MTSLDFSFTARPTTSFRDERQAETICPAPLPLTRSKEGCGALPFDASNNRIAVARTRNFRQSPEDEAEWIMAWRAVGKARARRRNSRHRAPNSAMLTPPSALPCVARSEAAKAAPRRVD